MEGARLARRFDSGRRDAAPRCNVGETPPLQIPCSLVKRHNHQSIDKPISFSRHVSRPRFDLFPPRRGVDGAPSGARVLARHPQGVHLTRHAGGGLTYRPCAPVTLGRCAQRRSIVAIFGKVSALSAPRQVGRGGSAIVSLPCLVRPGRRSLPPGKAVASRLDRNATPLLRLANASGRRPL